MTEERPRRCEAIQRSDQMSCFACRLVWDMNDAAPPRCGLEVSPVPPMPPMFEHGLNWLRVLATTPVAKQAIPAYVVGRLESEGFATTAELPSPFRNHKGKRISHLQITLSGRMLVGAKP